MKYLLFGAVFWMSCVCQERIKITQFSTNEKEIDTITSKGELLTYYNNFFLVSHYSESARSVQELDSFVAKYTSSTVYSPDILEIRFYFYKETSTTNIAEIKKNPRLIDRYSNDHDFIYYYVVKPDGTKIREKYKNGNLVESTDDKIAIPKFKVIKQPK